MIKVHKPPTMDRYKLVVMFYGITDSGKTFLLGSAQRCEETKPMLLIDLDGGTLTLAGSDIHVNSPRNFDDLQAVYDWLRTDNNIYRSVGIDSVTAQQRDISMPTIMGEIDEDQAMQNLGTFKPPHRQDWLSSQHHMRKFLSAFRGLARLRDPERRIHVFMTASERVDERRDLGVPALPGVLGTEVGGYVDVLGRLVLDLQEDDDAMEVRYLYTTKHVDEQDGLVYLGKNRRRLLPRKMKNPTIDKMMKYWREAK